MRTHRSRPIAAILGAIAVAGVAAVLCAAGWKACGRYGERCEQAGQFFPEFNVESHRIDLVMHDLNRNGIIDTWVYRDGRQIREIELDRDEDGTIDRMLRLDESGTLRVSQLTPRR